MKTFLLNELPEILSLVLRARHVYWGTPTEGDRVLYHYDGGWRIIDWIGDPPPEKWIIVRG